MRLLPGIPTRLKDETMPFNTWEVLLKTVTLNVKKTVFTELRRRSKR